MKNCYLLLLVMIPIMCRAQGIHLKGGIRDAVTNNPIYEATISMQAKKIYYPTNRVGRFDLVSDKLSLTDTIYFSCIGYQTRKICVRNLKIDTLITLSPLIKILSEVNIRTNRTSVIKVGSKAKSDDFMSAWYPTYSLAMFMQGSENAKGTIQTIGFYLSNGSKFSNNRGGNVTSPFRIKIYSVDTNGMPGEELTKDIIIASAKKNNEWFDVDISAYNIQNPQKGFFAAYCLLDSSYYKIKYNLNYNGISTSAADVITARLGGKDYKSKNIQSYWGHDSIWGWTWDKIEYNYMIRATIMPD